MTESPSSSLKIWNDILHRSMRIFHFSTSANQNPSDPKQRDTIRYSQCMFSPSNQTWHLHFSTRCSHTFSLVMLPGSFLLHNFPRGFPYLLEGPPSEGIGENDFYTIWAPSFRNTKIGEKSMYPKNHLRKTWIKQIYFRAILEDYLDVHGS